MSAFSGKNQSAKMAVIGLSLAICLTVNDISAFSQTQTTQTQPLQRQSPSSDSFIPADFVFNNDLRFGDSRYPDVNYLQYLLDQDKKTEVASFGAGSRDDTSSYYGLKTRDAVSRFQQIYSEEILKPAGLTQPTGFFGKQTRAKANQILGGMKTGARAATSTVTSTFAPISTSTVSGTPLIEDEGKIRERVSAKIDNQVSSISNQSAKETLKKQIMNEFEASLAKSKSRSSTDDFKLLKYISEAVKDAFTPARAHAEQAEVFSGSSDIAMALKETAFGGMYLFNIQCTCSYESLSYVLDYKSDSMLALLYDPLQSVLYLNYNIYGTYQLGSYADTTRSCNIYIGEDCIDITADGLYGKGPGTGTSLKENSTHFTKR